MPYKGLSIFLENARYVRVGLRIRARIRGKVRLQILIRSSRTRGLSRTLVKHTRATSVIVFSSQPVIFKPQTRT